MFKKKLKINKYISVVKCGNGTVLLITFFTKMLIFSVFFRIFVYRF